MSSVLQGLSCFFHDPLKFLITKNNFLNVIGKVDCNDYYNRYHTFEVLGDLEARLNISIDTERDWQFVMIVRDPIERFLSGYLYMCYAGLFGTCERLSPGEERFNMK